MTEKSGTYFDGMLKKIDMKTTKQTLLILIMVLFVNKVVNAKDLIVTIYDDSINCAIIKEKGDFTIYKIIGKSYSINQRSIKTIVPKFYSDNIDVASIIITKEQIKTVNEQRRISLKPNFIPRREMFNADINIGFNYTKLLEYMNNTNEKTMRNYTENIKTSHGLQMSAQLYFKDRIGLGLGYSYYAKSLSAGLVDYGFPNIPFYYEYELDVYLHSISPSLLIKTPIVKNKYSLILDLGVDYNYYKSPFKVDIKSYELVAESVGYHFGLVNQFTINKYFYWALNCTYSVGLIDKGKLSDGTTIDNVYFNGFDRININRLSVGVALGIQ